MPGHKGAAGSSVGGVWRPGGAFSASGAGKGCLGGRRRLYGLRSGLVIGDKLLDLGLGRVIRHSEGPAIVETHDHVN